MKVHDTCDRNRVYKYVGRGSYHPLLLLAASPARLASCCTSAERNVSSGAARVTKSLTFERLRALSTLYSSRG